MRDDLARAILGFLGVGILTTAVTLWCWVNLGPLPALIALGFILIFFAIGGG